VVAVLLMTAALPFGDAAVHADIIGTFDENGNGSSVDNVTGLTATFTGMNGVDPFDPGNGLMPLVYDLTTSLPMVNGDLVVTDPVSAATTDIFRFFTDPTTTRNLLIVYSDLGTGGSLADVGIPGTLQTDTLSLTLMGPPEGPNGIFNYMPTADQPGYVNIQAGGFSGNLIYNLISVSVVPEPASLVLLGVGLAAAAGAFGLGGSRRRDV
jgi:hypothetical protein